MANNKYAPQKKYAEKLKERTTQIGVRYYDGMDDDLLTFIKGYAGNTNQFIKDAIREKIERAPRDSIQQMDSKYWERLSDKEIMIRAINSLDGNPAYKVGDFIDSEKFRSCSIFRLMTIWDYEYYFAIGIDGTQIIFQVLGNKYKIK